MFIGKKKLNFSFETYGKGDFGEVVSCDSELRSASALDMLHAISICNYSYYRKVCHGHNSLVYVINQMC